LAHLPAACDAAFAHEAHALGEKFAWPEGLNLFRWVIIGRGCSEAKIRRCGGGVEERQRAAIKHAIVNVIGGHEYD
jgi:hypothetical protein